MHIHIYIHTYIHLFVYIYPMILNCTYLFTLIYMYVYIYIRTYECTNVDTYICIYDYKYHPSSKHLSFLQFDWFDKAFVNLEALRSKESIDSGNAISYFKCELLRSRVNCSFSRNTTMWKGWQGLVFFEKGNGILLKATPNIFKEIVPITETARRKRVDLSRGILYTRAGTA
jgi:hypothetical protein